MLGLKRDTVQVVTYHADWHDLFEQERRVLHKHIGHLVVDIQHVGSTAVLRLDAKPIIDMAVAVASVAAIPQCRLPLCSLGYLDRGDAGIDGGYLFVKESAPDIRTHHLHIVARDDPRWGDYLRFRDVLKADATLRTRYANLKKASQEKFSQDRKAYTASKHAFIQDILQQSKV
jgi:GrpB-like predicted nucleotidyltransferase (UPF0157 family)